MIDFDGELGKKARQHIEREYFIWMTTVDSKHAPQPRPVWYIWHDEAFLIYSKANAHKLRQIRSNPHVALHFNTSDTQGDEDVLVFSGEAEIVSDAPLAKDLPAYMEKYAAGIAGLPSTPKEFSADYSVAIRVRPATLRD